MLPAGIIICGKLPLAVCGIGVHQRVPIIDAVNGSCKRCIPLGLSGFFVYLCHFNAEFLQNIGHSGICDFLPLDCGLLLLWHYIAGCGVHFFKGVWLAARN